MVTTEDVLRVARAADLPAAGSNLKADVPLVSQGFDSLDMATLMLELERAYNQAIPPEKAARLRTLDDIVAFLNR